MKKKTAVSCHHGDIDRQNNLEAATLIMQEHPEIDIMEIDFVLYNRELISSHDYSTEGILNGSSLTEWIDLVILRHSCMLWIDLKPQALGLGTFLESWSTAKEEADVLFGILREARERHRTVLDIRDFIMITSQDRAIIKEIDLLNQANEWRIVADIPHLQSYIWQYILPLGMQDQLNDAVFEYFVKQYDFSAHSVVAIDKSFFGHNLRRVFEFVRASTIKEGSTLILYNFTHDDDPVVRSKCYDIVMQYDFHRRHRQSSI